MKVDVKEYLTVGVARSMDVKVYEYEKVKDLESLKEIEPMYEGSVDDAPREIREKIYVKVDLGNPTIYYVV